MSLISSLGTSSNTTKLENEEIDAALKTVQKFLSWDVSKAVVEHNYSDFRKAVEVLQSANFFLSESVFNVQSALAATDYAIPAYIAANKEWDAHQTSYEPVEGLLCEVEQIVDGVKELQDSLSIVNEEIRDLEKKLAAAKARASVVTNQIQGMISENQSTLDEAKHVSPPLKSFHKDHRRLQGIMVKGSFDWEDLKKLLALTLNLTP